MPKNYDSGVSIFANTIFNDMILSPDGSVIYGVNVDGSISQISAATGAELHRWTPVTGNGGPFGLSISSDGRTLAMAAAGNPTFDQQGNPATPYAVYRLDTTSGAAVKYAFPASAGEIGDTATLVDGAIALSTAAGGFKLISPAGVISTVAGTSTFGKAVLSVSADGTHVLAGQQVVAETVQSASFAYENDKLVALGTTSISQPNAVSFHLTTNSGIQAVNPNGNTFVQFYDGIGPDVYDSAMNFVLNLRDINSHWIGGITGISFDATGQHLFLAQDNSLPIIQLSVGDWHVEASFAVAPGTKFRAFFQPTFLTYGNSLAISPDGNFAFALASDGIEKVDLHFFGGTETANTLTGTAAGDTFNGRAGNDTLAGGAGLDVAAYVATRAEATVTRDAANHALTIASQADGTDTARAIEQFHFADGLYSFQFASAGTVLANFGGAQGWTSQAVLSRQLADVNGDGKLDIVGFGHSAVRVALGNGDGTFQAASVAIANFGAAQDWDSQDHYPRLLADVNGDGRADIIGFGYGGTYVALGQADGTFAAKQLGIANFGGALGWTSQDANLRLVADVNGDGKADILGFGYSAVRVALGNGDGTFQAAKVALADMATLEGWTSQAQYARQLADVNGDGKLDLVGFGHFAVFTALGNGDGTFQASQVASADLTPALGWASQNAFPRLLADVNGDGRADLVGFGQDGTSVALANADGTFAAARVAVAAFGQAQGWSSLDATPRTIVDVNHDGKLDILGFGPSGTSLAFGNGDGTFGEVSQDLANFGNAQGWNSADSYFRQIADLNGDRLPDLVGFGFAGVKVALNQGDFLA